MRGQGFAFIAPLLVLMVVAFNLPILYMLGLAFWEKGRGFTLEHYEGLLEAPVYLRVLGNTLRISLIATIANVLIGYPLAHWMRGLSNRARLIGKPDRRRAALSERRRQAEPYGGGNDRRHPRPKRRMPSERTHRPLLLVD